MKNSFRFILILLGFLPLSALLFPAPALADGVVRPPLDYEGSLEETAQEAVIISWESDSDETWEDLILKIRVEGDVRRFCWIIPFPNPPETRKEDAKLFKELFDYVEALRPRKKGRGLGLEAKAGKTDDEVPGVDVISRKIVGSFDVAVVRETEPGKLNAWLEDQGYQPLRDAEDVLGYYRSKGYVYACVKVSDAALEKGKGVDLHPLSFTFKTGGKDGIYFPMKMTGLQRAPFDVNLYVFYRAWLNDDLNRYGFVHRGFRLVHRDWDTRECLPNGGKTWSSPETDPFLRRVAALVPTVKALMQRRHPGERFYLTNLNASKLKPEEVRRWKGDLWLFPHYTNKGYVPEDTREGGPASEIYPSLPGAPAGAGSGSLPEPSAAGLSPLAGMLLLLTAVVAVLVAFLIFVRAKEAGA